MVISAAIIDDGVSPGRKGMVIADESGREIYDWMLSTLL